ncbi:hypothetical protein LIER_41370 [Lithospermum erythrorhizon]|uniref:Disease resistance N-terminal domain-containing protein n=1 Tax=Lithospermum erythrorhizon TaxID=34254 RepID=A0AAV3R8B1_LITER
MDMASVAVELALNQAHSVLGDHEFISNVENFKENLETEAVKGWLQIVEAIAIDVDDLLEEYAYEVLRETFEESQEKDREVSPQVFTSIVSVMVDKIKEINLSLERICQESVNIGLIQLIKNPSGEHELCLIGNYIHKLEILGRENDVN